MSYRLIDSNEIAIKYPEVNEMDCIYVDLPNGLDNEYHYIEAEPIKHGRWKQIAHPWYECSECGERTAVVNLNGKVLWHYCPNCGAKMQSTMGQVKHGHWIKYGSPLFSEWECSECGERHTGNDLPDTCPHCKARMDEVEE